MSQSIPLHGVRQLLLEADDKHFSGCWDNEKLIHASSCSAIHKMSEAGGFNGRSLQRVKWFGVLIENEKLIEAESLKGASKHMPNMQLYCRPAWIKVLRSFF